VTRHIIPTHTRFAIAGSVILGAAIVLAGACVDSRSRDRSPTKPLFSLLEEEGVTADVYQDVSLRTPDSTYTFAFPDTTVYAPFVAGWAYPDSEAGVPLALGVTTEGYPYSGESHSNADTLVDSLNNVHVLAWSAAQGTPPSHFQYFLNGSLG